MVLVLPPALAPLKDSSALAVAVGFALVATAATAVLLRRHDAPKAKTRDGKPLRQAHALPNSRFLVGDLLEVANNAEYLYDWMSDVSLSFGNEPWRTRILGRPDAIVISTPDGIEDVLVKQSFNFPRGEEANASVSDVFGKSLLTMDGHDWLRQRKTAAKFFTAKALRICMTTTMHKTVLQMYEVLDQHVASGATLDLSHLLSQFALQTFTQVGLGVDLRWIGSDESSAIGELTLQGTPVLMRRGHVPTFWWKLERYLNFGPERKLSQVMVTGREWIQAVMNKSLDAFAKRQHERSKDKKNEESGDAVKSMIELFFEHSQEDADGLRSEDMVDFILTFVLAAQDTSSLTLTRFFAMLAKHPEVAQRVHQEMEAVLPPLGVTKDTYLTTEHIHHLVYLDATIHEVLRLYPTVPMIGREAADDTIVSGVLVRKGSVVFNQSYAMARNPKVWGPDAAEFKPERWIDPTTRELLKFPPTKFLAFGAGPHMCIGMKLGMMELRVVAANLVHRYALSLAVPNDGEYRVGVTLMMKNPLLVKVKHAVDASAP
jgi:cytochrome P450